MALSPAQRTIAYSPARFKVLISGRRFGKTYLALREICKYARFPGVKAWYVAPTYRQAKQIAWAMLKKKLNEVNWAYKYDETDLTAWLKNGALIQLRGADNPDSLRGVGLNFIALDEFADIKGEAWYEVLRPTLSDTNGAAMFGGTPKGIGNWAKDVFDLGTGSENVDWQSFHYATIDGGRVPQSEVDMAMAELDERTFRQEYMAEFVQYSGLIYYAFLKERYDFGREVGGSIVNIDNLEGLNMDKIHVGMDFNVDPMTSNVWVCDDYESVTIQVDEIRIRGSNTHEMAQEIRQRFPDKMVACYPDPTGKSRRTSSPIGVTDLKILEDEGFEVNARRQSPLVRDRINAVNSRFKSADGSRHAFIDYRCKHSIKCFTNQIFKEGTSQPDKDSGYDHSNDASGYYIEYMWPVAETVSEVVAVGGT